ncbi:MAG: protein translocase subunit SecD [Chloroflexota bacterium]|nr:protein translocase subunit SecD [Chloroflexota bacterium]
MRQNLAAMVAAIILLVLIAGGINLWPNADLNWIGIDKAFPVKLGLDLQGGSQVVLQVRPGPNTTDKTVLASNLQAARDVIESRAAGSGVSEPLVQVQGNDRIIVELPGVQNPDEVLKTLRETGYLEWIDAGNESIPEGSLVTTEAGPPSPDQLGRANGVTPTSTVPITGTQTLTGTQAITSTATVSPTAGLTSYGNGKVYKVVINGSDVDGTKAAATIDSQSGKPIVSFTLKGDGPRKLQEFTQRSVPVGNVFTYMPIVLDKKVISSPYIASVIPNGSGQITTNSMSEAQKLAIQLRYGALPVTLDVVQQRTVGATLGSEGVQRSVVAGIVGLSIVMLFMLLFYRLPGLLADIALLIFALITFAIFRFIPVTLTLAGIAGFILSIGMAVDANVLIFARIREELRSGKTVGAAVEAGFDHAWPSIRDSNATTLIITLILYWFGSFVGGATVIKGFALTLFISVAVSLFTAITISRTLLRLVVSGNRTPSRWWFGIDAPKPAAPPPSGSGTQPVV